jgi:hypothetical protein
MGQSIIQLGCGAPHATTQPEDLEEEAHRAVAARAAIKGPASYSWRALRVGRLAGTVSDTGVTVVKSNAGTEGGRNGSSLRRTMNIPLSLGLGRDISLSLHGSGGGFGTYSLSVG